jgi:hypothetical protein
MADPFRAGVVLAALSLVLYLIALAVYRHETTWPLQDSEWSATPHI